MYSNQIIFVWGWFIAHSTHQIKSTQKSSTQWFQFQDFSSWKHVMTWEELCLPGGSLTREGKIPSVDNNPTDYKCAEFSHVNKLHFNKHQVPYMSGLLRTVHFENFMYLYDRLEQASWWIHNYLMIKRSFSRHSESLNKYVAILGIIIQTLFWNNIFKAIFDTKIKRFSHSL